MKPFNIDSIAKTFLFSIFFMILTVSVIFGSYWIYKKYDFFHTESQKIKTDYITKQKKLLKAEVEKLIKELDYERSLAKKEFDLELKYCTLRTYDTSLLLYQMMQDTNTTEEIKNQIIKTVKKRYENNHRYIYIHQTSGDFKTFLFPFNKKLENNSLVNIKDKKGNYIFVNLSLMIREKKENYYDFFWPLKKRRIHFRSYNKFFEPLQYNIGCAKNIDNIKKSVEKRVISNFIHSKRDNKFLCDISLLQLYNIKGGKNFAKFIIQRNKPQLTNKYISDTIKDKKGIEYAKKYLKDIKKKRESFFFQNIKTLEGNDASKLIYYKLYPPYNWIVGGTVCLAKIEKSIKYQEKLLQEYIMIKILKFFFVFLFTLLFSFLVAKYFSKKIQNSFRSFNDFFQEATKTFVKIDSKKFFFKEFKEMARSANAMIDEYKKAKKELEFSQQYLQLMLDTQDSLVVVTDSHLISANRSFFEFFGFKDMSNFKEQHDCICEFFVNKGEEYLQRKVKGEAWFRYVYKYPELTHKVVMKKDDKEHIFVITSKRMDYKNKARYVCVFTDITEVEKQRKRFQFVATTDPLIKIANRLQFDTILDKQIEIFIRYKQPFSLIFFDIDHFKKINDEYGHKTGDMILIKLAKLVSLEIRKSDTFARWGGEEFAVIMPKINKKTAGEIAEKLREKIEKHDFKFGKKVTCSFGVTQMKTGDTANSIVTRVDEALYKAKNEGRNRVVLI